MTSRLHSGAKVLPIRISRAVRHRCVLGYSMNKFSKMAGVSVAVLSLYGSGGRPLTWDTLFVLAKALNIKAQINVDIP